MLSVVSEQAVTVAWISGAFLLAAQIATGVFAYLANRTAAATRRDAERAAYQTQPSNGVRLATIVEHLDKKLDNISSDLHATRTALFTHLTDTEIH